MEVNQELVNVQDALKRIGGSMDLYKRLLTSFTGGDHINPLEEALSSGTMEQAAHIIHTLKGTAANLSLTKLSSAATELEHKVKSGMEHSDAFAELKNIYFLTSQEISKVY